MGENIRTLQITKGQRSTILTWLICAGGLININMRSKLVGQLDNS